MVDNTPDEIEREEVLKDFTVFANVQMQMTIRAETEDGAYQLAAEILDNDLLNIPEVEEVVDIEIESIEEE